MKTLGAVIASFKIAVGMNVKIKHATGPIMTNIIIERSFLFLFLTGDFIIAAMPAISEINKSIKLVS
jgi:hypothetical protein